MPSDIKEGDALYGEKFIEDIKILVQKENLNCHFCGEESDLTITLPECNHQICNIFCLLKNCKFEED